MKSARTLIKLTDAMPEEVRDPSLPSSGQAFRFGQPINLSICEGDTLIICGPNGSGKTVLADMLRGARRLSQGQRETASDLSICYATFHDQYSTGVNTGSSAYQMRWNQGAMDEDFEPRVSDLFRNAAPAASPNLFSNGPMPSLASMADRKVISLSSGEFRRLQLTLLLARCPKVLMIDNPFIGLDCEGRRMVADMLMQLTANSDMALVLITSRFIPGNAAPAASPNLFSNGQCSSTSHLRAIYEPSTKDESMAKGHNNPIVVDARNITIRYGSRTILHNFSIQIHQGEHWALKGPNGSGKSTLLSLICADNPQSYACDITLFGRRRGTGESIWEIKKNIGFVSPEMYRAYRRNLPVKHIVASGLHDSTGLFHQPSPEDYQSITKWMDTFGLNKWAERNYLSLSSGEQRWVLLCRAFVKNPPLLILDEPLHGLDDDYRHMAIQIICQYFINKPHRTLIMVSHYDEDFPSIIDHTCTLNIDRSRTGFRSKSSLSIEH